jgi:hypothetical protein
MKIIMAKDIKSEGPTCACGKGDLYEDWKKLNEDKKDEGSESTDSKNAGEDKIPGEAAVKDTQMKGQTKK